MRRHNLGLVLRHVAEYGPCARTEVAAATGLGHASVTGITAELVERGLVREVGPAVTGARGRPRRLLRLVPERVMAIAVQVTLERVEVMAGDLAGAVVHRVSEPHHAPYGEPRPLAAVIAREIGRAAAVVGETCEGAYLARAVVAMAGPVTGPGNTVAAAIDFGWRHTDLRALVEEHLPSLGCPVEVVNDANVAALAEYHARAGALRASDGVSNGTRDGTGDGVSGGGPGAVPRGPGGELPYTVAYIKADTGVGGGLLIDGRIHTGSRGTAGEIGHIPLALDGPECPCGARGCLALYVGPEPLTAAAGLAGLAAADGLPAALAELDRRLRADDPYAVDALAQAGRTLGAAILAIWALTDAGEVILGGYLATWGRWLLPGIAEALERRHAVAAHLEPAIVLGVLGADATLQGALWISREATFDDPTAVPVR